MGSTKDRAAQNKRPKPPKQRRDDSESFDRRSQYTPFFPQPQVPTWVPQPQYSTMSTQPFNATLQNNYQPAIPPQYVQPSQQYNQNMMSNGNMQQYNNMAQQYPQQPQRFQPHSAPITTYGTPVQSPQLPPNSGNNSSSLCTRTKPLTNHRRPVEDLQVRFRMLLANCLVPSILLIQRVNIRFLEASIDTRSTQRPSRSSQTILVFQFLSLSLITVLLTKDLHTMALLTCLIMVLLRRSRNMVTAWATTWFDRVRTTPCHPTMHLPTCLTVL